MKLWVKIALGVQVLLMIFFIVLARIQAAEADKQTVMALMEADNALRAREEAERHIALARAAQAEAELQRALAKESEAELAKCSGKK